MCEFKGRDIVRGRNVVDYKATWTMDLGLNSSVAGHVTSDTGVLGSIPSPVIYFLIVKDVCICSLLPSFCKCLKGNYMVLSFMKYTFTSSGL